MKLKLLIVVLISFIPTLVMAQSAFSGFYGQISTGYENNQLGSSSATTTVIPHAKSDTTSPSASQNFGGAPLVFGVGYYWKANDKWLLGVGADYSALTQNSSNISIGNATNAAGSTIIRSGETSTYNGATMQLSNRFNLFLTPAYVIDKDKLVYLKAGYSQVSAQYNRSTSSTKTVNGLSTSYPATNGNQTSNQGGYLIGVGYKQIIRSGLYGFVEGNYMGYSAPSYTFTCVNAADTARCTKPNSTRTIVNNFASLNTYQLLVGLGYAF
jgi:hypothetical protein